MNLRKSESLRIWGFYWKRVNTESKRSKLESQKKTKNMEVENVDEVYILIQGNQTRNIQSCNKTNIYYQTSPFYGVPFSHSLQKQNPSLVQSLGVKKWVIQEKITELDCLLFYLRNIRQTDDNNCRFCNCSTETPSM